MVDVLLSKDQEDRPNIDQVVELCALETAQYKARVNNQQQETTRATNASTEDYSVYNEATFGG